MLPGMGYFWITLNSTLSGTTQHPWRFFFLLALVVTVMMIIMMIVVGKVLIITGDHS